MTRKAPQKADSKHAAKPAAAKPSAAKPAAKKNAAGKRPGTIAPFVEELEVALAELRRLSKELVYTRRQFVDEAGAGRGAEASMRQQLEALRTELKTARADLEIAQANARRIETRLEAAAEAEARARESQREAEHAADRARDELLWLRREVDRRPPAGTPPTPTRSSGEGQP